ncbi:hypothetical protein IAI18_19760 [Acetobacteraceae bacterium H6797]|nr:hypothetical protein [Acetobacteraceae bacterium H6797]
MSAERDGEVIRLMGDCPAGDAETLLALLQQEPGLGVDVTEAGGLHTAVVQVLLALRPAVRGELRDPFLNHWIRPLLPEPSPR